MGVVPKDRSRLTAAAAEGRGGGSSRVGAALPDVHLCSSTRTAQTEGGEAHEGSARVRRTHRWCYFGRTITRFPTHTLLTRSRCTHRRRALENRFFAAGVL